MMPCDPFCRRRLLVTLGVFSVCLDGSALVRGLAVGSRHACVLLDDDSVKCFGQNDYGQLGLGDTNPRNTSTTMGDNLDAVDLGSGLVVAMSAGNDHTCVVFSDGRLKCFGKNDKGQLGLDDTENRGDGATEMGSSLPDVSLGVNRTAVDVMADGDRTCALLDTLDVRCWGDGEFGALGNGAEDNTGDGAVEVDATVDIGGSSVSALCEGPCVIVDDGSVKCWGKGYYGKNGQGDAENIGDASGEMGRALGTVPLGTEQYAHALSGGRDYVCALLVDGSIKCWGRGEGGQLGTEDIATLGDDPDEMDDALRTIDLGRGAVAIEVTAGQQHTCALLDTGAVKCWGKNFYGNLGIGDFRAKGHFPETMGSSLVEVDLGTGRIVLSVRAKEERTCAILDDGNLKCWGHNEDGILGLGDTEPRGLDPSEMGDNLPAVDFGTNRTVVAFAPEELPTDPPTPSPTLAPTMVPTSSPTLAPTPSPTHAPTRAPTHAPTAVGTAPPTVPPTPSPTVMPTSPITPLPTTAPVPMLTPQPTLVSTPQPTRALADPSPSPTNMITAAERSTNASDDGTATIVASVAAPVGILLLLAGVVLYTRRRNLMRASAAAVGAKAAEADASH